MADFHEEEQQWIEANASDPAVEIDILYERLRLMTERAEAAEAKLETATKALTEICDVADYSDAVEWYAMIARRGLDE